MRDAGLFTKIKHGVKLLAEGKDRFKTKIDIEVTAVSKEARRVVEECGGKVNTVYFSALGLRTFLKNDPKDIKIDFARAPPYLQHRYDIPKYSLSLTY
jgi:hypothetical protein